MPSNNQSKTESAPAWISDLAIHFSQSANPQAAKIGSKALL
jgi:hypothetical protein